MTLRSCLLALLGGTLMTATALAAPRFDVYWKQVVYKDADGKDQTVVVDTKDPDPGYDGGLGLPAVAMNKDVVFKGDYLPGGKATIKVTIRERDRTTGDEYTGTFIKGKWEITIPKGKLQVATVYDVTVEATIDGRPVLAKHCMNVANN